MLPSIMEHKDYRLAAIMYTDIVGFSRMMEKDEAATLKLLSYHNALVTEIAERRHGTIIKTIGDAFLVDFRNTVEALQCAIEVQEKLHAYNLEHRDLPLLLRIGVHLGDIWFFENDALGEGINIAARLQSLARPGTICMSQDVYNLVLNKLDFRAEKLGKVSLKNITKEIHAYEIVTPNVEFDPKRHEPRPGLPAAETAGDQGAALPIAPSSSEPARKVDGEASGQASRGYGPGASADLLEEVRKAVLEDTKALGRRMTVGEALSKYGDRGVEAKEAIAALVDKGIVARDRPATAKAGFDGEALGRDIERAVSGIVDAIEYGIRKSSGRHDAAGTAPTGRGAEIASRIGELAGRAVEKAERHAEREAARHGRKADAIVGEALRRVEDEALETHKWDKELKDSDYFKPGREDRALTFGEYRDGLEERRRKTVGGLVGNALSFLGVNAFLWYLNLGVAGGGAGLAGLPGALEGRGPFLWAAIVTAGWGTGVVANVFAAFRARAKARDAEKLPELGEESLDALRKLNRVKDSMARHNASILTVPLLLAVINQVTTQLAPPWFLIPSAIMAISWISHAVTYGMTKRRLERKLWATLGAKNRAEALRSAGKVRAAGAEAGPYASLLAEAAQARDALVAQIKAAGSEAPFDADMIPSLDQYVEQVALLAKTVNEIDAIVDSVPMQDLSKDKAELAAKLERAGSESLKGEYRSSIAEIEKQEASFRDLQDQKEVLGLRLRSSVNQLKQMRLDLARLRTAPGVPGDAALKMVRTRTDELAKYLEDVRRGYEDVKGDPWEELERIAAEREAAAARPALPASSEAYAAPPPDAAPGAEREGAAAPKAGKIRRGEPGEPGASSN